MTSEDLLRMKLKATNDLWEIRNAFSEGKFPVDLWPDVEQTLYAIGLWADIYREQVAKAIDEQAAMLEAAE